MKLITTPLNDEFVKQIASWRYDDEYAIYNLPNYEVMKERNFGLLDFNKRDNYLAFVNENNELVGYAKLVNINGKVFFGIGLKPDWCGKGIGKEAVTLSINESRKRYADLPLYLEVRTWNKRAVKCYQSQGFNIIDKINIKSIENEDEFYIMVYNFI